MKILTKSKTKPDITYTTEMTADGILQCNCPAFQYRNKCSHAKELMNNINDLIKNSVKKIHI